MFRKFYAKNKRTIDKFDGLLLNNTVLERGLVVAPIIVMANTFINALILGMAFVIITFVTDMFSSFVPKKIPYTIRVIIYTITACLMFIPTAKLMDNMFPDTIYKLGIFLPLLVTNSLIVTKTETRFFKMERKKMMVDLLCHVLGFFVVIVIVGEIREVLGSGTFMGKEIEYMKKMSVFSLPFGGFIVVGFMAAIMQRFTNNLYGKDVKKSLKEKD